MNTSGTSIQDLHSLSYQNPSQEPQVMQNYDNLQRVQSDDDHLMQHDMHFSAPQSIAGQTTHSTLSHADHIAHLNRHRQEGTYPEANQMASLARDISANLPDSNRYEGDVGPRYGEGDTLSQVELDDVEEELRELVKDSDSSLISFVPEYVRDPLIIVVLFFLLSQPFVKTMIGRYVKQIQPGSDGAVSNVGVLIYGVVLAVLFYVSKKSLMQDW